VRVGEDWGEVDVDDNDFMNLVEYLGFHATINDHALGRYAAKEDCNYIISDFSISTSCSPRYPYCHRVCRACRQPEESKPKTADRGTRQQHCCYLCVPTHIAWNRKIPLPLPDMIHLVSIVRVKNLSMREDKRKHHTYQVRSDHNSHYQIIDSTGERAALPYIQKYPNPIKRHHPTIFSSLPFLIPKTSHHIFEITPLLSFPYSSSPPELVDHPPPHRIYPISIVHLQNTL
jgi:hypothetical protein